MSGKGDHGPGTGKSYSSDERIEYNQQKVVLFKFDRSKRVNEEEKKIETTNKRTITARQGDN